MLSEVHLAEQRRALVTETEIYVIKECQGEVSGSAAEGSRGKRRERCMDEHLIKQCLLHPPPPPLFRLLVIAPYKVYVIGGEKAGVLIGLPADVSAEHLVAPLLLQGRSIPREKQDSNPPVSRGACARSDRRVRKQAKLD